MIALARPAVLALLTLLCSARALHADVYVRWDHDPAPSRQSLDIDALVVPAAKPAVLRGAVAAGYRVYAEVDAAALSGFADTSVHGVVVSGPASDRDVESFRARLNLTADRLLTVRGGAKWPHIRTNWVTRNNDVLQVAGRSAQPWIENNAALLRVLQAERPDRIPVLSYQWQPITRAQEEEGPSLEDYLVAIAEAGSFGGDLVLPLHGSFQKRLVAGDAAARAEWLEMKRAIEFYSRDPRKHQVLANVAVVTSQPMVWFEAMNLLARHNVPFELIHPSQLATRDLKAFKLLILIDAASAELPAVAAFVRGGGKVHKLANTIADPNRFALEMRKLLGAGDRVIDIWNGITVLVVPYASTNANVMVALLNYAHQPLPVQLRVKGTFSTVQYESPEQPRAAVPHQHRLGYTEFVLPAVRVGGRVFLSRDGLD